MRTLRILLIMAALWAPPALACTPGPDHEKWEREYYNAVTSVYVAVAEDFDPEDPRYPSDNFSVLLRPVEVVWGAAPAPQPLKLEYTAGACDEWFLWGNDYNEPLDGRRYLVFVAPQARNDLSRLHIQPAEGRNAAQAMELLRALQSGVRTVEGEGGEDLLPQSAPTWSVRRLKPEFIWLSLGGVGIAITVGLALRRAGRNSKNRPGAKK